MDCSMTSSGQELTAMLKGSFTAADAPGFRDVLKRLESSPCAETVFDLSGLEFADSAALSLMILAQRTLGKTGKRMVVRGLKGQVKRVVELTQLNEIFTVVT